MKFECSHCKKEVKILHKLGGLKICLDCDNLLRRSIYGKLSPEKVMCISKIEEMMLADIWILAKSKGYDIQFQYDIFDSKCIIKNKDYFSEACKYIRCISSCKYNKSFVKYILDFALFKNNKKIDLELDGVSFHNKDYDDERDQFMEERGWIILRIPSTKIFRNKNLVLQEIERNL